jgi:uroporphyrinogen-III synthase
MADLPLAGRAVGVTADRRGDDQVVMFERLGAEVVLGPTLTTVKVPDPELLRQRTADLIADPPDFFIADTGIGMRTWLEAADGWGQKPALVAAMGRARIAARGPKAAGALSSAGLSAWWRSPTEQLGDLVEHLVSTGVDGRTVTFQLHGDDGAEFVSRLASAGAAVTTIPVYVWQPPADPAPALDLIERIRAGRIDAVTFTAGPQVRSLMGLAEADVDDLVRALNQMVVGCIGPVCAGVAQECGITRPVVPGAWRLGSLVKAVTEALAR